MSERSARHVHAHAVAEGLRGLPARASRHLCQNCRERRARFRYRGAIKTDPDHTLCFECYRALHNSLREMVRAVSFFALRATTRGSQEYDVSRTNHETAKTTSAIDRSPDVNDVLCAPDSLNSNYLSDIL